MELKVKQEYEKIRKNFNFNFFFGYFKCQNLQSVTQGDIGRGAKIFKI